MLRVLVDTNVWVSALLNPKGFPARLLAALPAEEFVPIMSDPLLDELIDVLSRPRLATKYHLDPRDVAEFVTLLEKRAELVKPSGKLRLCRDGKDDMVLETALEGQAEYAVSRDDDLKRDMELIIQMQAHGLKIMSVRQFLDVLERHRSRLSDEPGSL